MHCSNDKSTVQSFYKKLCDVCRPMGMSVSKPNHFDVFGNHIESFVTAVYKAVQTCKDLQFIVIIVPNLREDRYNAVKRICCADIGIQSQVIKYASIHIIIY